ncbi:hypothetical protein QYS49_37640 [Marivirga salinae]|uniref:SusE outer membrane protein domain-containing protein n=1 Tax=Marivirga salinarum TaxID=3059078 RepID=A0AA51RDW6_9BACT|nr:hypothetical protein [Marivirga sp. BDSF4-3]WMN11234.1 hypothetical protein QYS49_37640 [Marivirga sp. BDSF4-3]
MKNLTKLWSLALLLTAAMFMVSCEEDEPTIDVDEDGLTVSDGLYLVAEGENPVATMQLTPEQVEADGFGAQERSGFVTGYFNLTAGSYNIVETVDREISATFGGSTETINSGTEDAPLTYDVVADATDDGQAFTVEAGLYKIAYDEMTGEIVIFNIESVGLIGAATPNGDDDTPLSGSVDENGGTWTGSDILLRTGWYKFRFNSSWNIDRRIDPDGGLGADNGYLMFTNFGGSIDNLEPGNVGGNFEMTAENEGIYDVEITFTNDGGFAYSQDRTGDAPEITFDPAEYQFGIIGSANANGFDADRNLHYVGLNEGVHKWVGVVYFGEESVDGERRFKFRTNDDWAFNLGGTLPADGSEATLAVNGADIAAPAAGAYYITLTTADEGGTWISTMTATGWGVIGEGSPSASWDADVDMTTDGFVEGVTTYTLTGEFTGEYKFRAGDSWDFNLGGDPTALNAGGDNLSVDAAGTYTVTLTFDGENYAATIE